MGALDGRIAVITGAGRGIGRAHALLFAREGAKVVVNDLGGAEDGSGADTGPAHDVVEEIKALGGEAVANTDNVAEFAGAERLIQSAIDAFGDLNVLVNNAGILRDRMLVNMSEAEWDDVVRVHLKGHFAPLRFAAAYWRERSKAGHEVNAAVVNTSSTSGLFNNPGQTNYGAAKTGITSLTIIAQKELERYGVRVNAIAPAAFTRLIATIPGRDAARGEHRVVTLGPRQHLPVRGLPVHRRLPDQGPGVLRPGRRRLPVPAVRHHRRNPQGRPVDDRRAEEPGGPARRRAVPAQPAEVRGLTTRSSGPSTRTRPPERP